MTKYLIYDKLEGGLAFDCEAFNRKQAKNIIKQTENAKNYILLKIPKTVEVGKMKVNKKTERMIKRFAKKLNPETRKQGIIDLGLSFYDDYVFVNFFSTDRAFHCGSIEFKR